MNIFLTVQSNTIRHLSIVLLVGLILNASLANRAEAAVGIGELEDFVNFESPQVHPLDLTPDGSRLLVVNTADNRIEIFEVLPKGLAYEKSIQVGLEPVSVRARNDQEAWVVNHLSDSITVIDIVSGSVITTLKTGDEPADVVFAGNPEKAFVTVSQWNRFEIFDPADLAASPTLVPIDGEDPRSLVTDGSKVYAAILEAGNLTTVISDDKVSSGLNPYPGNPNPPPNDGNGFNPPFRKGLPDAPENSLILRKNQQSQWMDDNGGDWSNAVTWDLHGHGLAVIDSETLNVSYRTGLPTTNMGSAIDSQGRIAVVGTEALNEIRFEPVLNGTFIRVEGAILSPSDSSPAVRVDLNPHLDYSVRSIPFSSRVQSIGDPRGVKFIPGSNELWVVGMGSRNVAIFDENFTRSGVLQLGHGPTGLAVDSVGERAYVLNRFDGTLSVIDVPGRVEIARVPFYDPTPQFINDGRPFLYDTHLTSGLGQASCASCHVDGRFDQLAWDLGDPSLEMFTNDVVCNINLPQLGECTDWHPIKGPMVTQTLVGISGTEPLHWRGDRADFAAFNHAFTGLLAADANGVPSEMAAMDAFLASIAFPPNPNRNLNGTMPTNFEGGNPNTGRDGFLDGNLDTINCNACHREEAGGTLPSSISPNVLPGTQSIKIPHLRNMYQKSGMDMSSQYGGKGFGFLHDGISDTMFNFLEFEMFEFPSNPAGDQLQRDVAAFMMCFETGTHAAIGAQCQIGGPGINSSDEFDRRDTLRGLALNNVGDLVVHVMESDRQRGGLLRVDGSYQSDSVDEIWDQAYLDGLAGPSSPVIYTLVPKGSGIRIALDRDRDGVFDMDETLSCSDPADPKSIPGNGASCGFDLNGDGLINAADLGLLLVGWGPCSVGESCSGDFNNDGQVNAADLGLLLVAWN